MLETRLEAPPGWWQLVAIRLLRRWAAATANGENPLPAVVELASSLHVGASAAVALASLYQLTENCLERALATECCCSRQTTGDERAVLVLIAAAPAPGEALASSHIPHGIPGVLAWSAAAVRRLLDSDFLAFSSAQCPFANSPGAAIASHSH